MKIRSVVVRSMLPRAGRRIDIGRQVFLGVGSNISIGNDSGIGERSELHGPIRIGAHVMISPDVMIHTRNHRFDDPDRPIGHQGYTPTQPVVIDDDVWIGARVIILPGVHVGRGAVVGAGSVVARDIPPLGYSGRQPSAHRPLPEGAGRVMIEARYLNRQSPVFTPRWVGRPAEPRQARH